MSTWPARGHVDMQPSQDFPPPTWGGIATVLFVKSDSHDGGVPGGGVRATRQYAKRQLTWFRHQSPAMFFELDEVDDQSRERIYGEIRSHLEEKLACYR